jgi:hypothetical protein
MRCAIIGIDEEARKGYVVLKKKRAPNDWTEEEKLA